MEGTDVTPSTTEVTDLPEATSLCRKACLLTVAIDFGTTFSGYAYSYAGDRRNLFMHKWGIDEHESYKTPTVVLTERGEDGSHTFLKFGYEAIKMYLSRLRDRELRSKTCLFNKFKMKLYNVKSLSKDTTITDKTGKYEARAMDIFAMALRYMKAHLLENFKTHGFTDLKADEIMWVLTVPAIWSDTAKQFMRESALQAGLITDGDSRRLLIALEPEAASFYCRGLERSKFLRESATGEISLPAGALYMVLDAGGGTVDITIHRVLDNRRVEEVHAATGGDWGGTRVDKNFTSVLTDILGETFVKRCQAELPLDWLKIETDFEFFKRNARPGVDEDLHLLHVSYTLGQAYCRYVEKSIEDVFEENNIEERGITFLEGYVSFNQKAMDDLFNPVVDETVAHVKDLMSKPKLQGISHIFMVGGFSTSPYLYTAVRREFGHKAEVLIPHDPELAIVKGAVLFGHNPGEVESRIARKSYGTRILAEFVEGTDPDDRKIVVEGEAYCKGKFSPFVRKNQSIKKGEVKTFSFNPAHSSQTKALVPLIVSDSETIEYTDDHLLDEVGEITLSIPDTSKGKDRDIDVRVTIGGTELIVHVQDSSRPDGEEVEENINFLAV